MLALSTHFKNTINAHCSSHARFFIGYSGGLDSSVLLQLAKEALPNLEAIHVNHQIQPCADEFEAHCRAVCKTALIPLHVHTVTQNFSEAKVTNKSLSLEMFAREQRYAFFEQYVQNDHDVILLAHHQDDQAETVLLNLLRGTGIDGLKGMPIARQFCKGQIIRPMLSVSQAALHAYALEHQLDFIDDPSNDDTTISRNFLRKKIMPLLESRWKGASKRIANTALLLQAQTPIRQAPEQILIEQLRLLSPNTQAEQVRDWVKSKTGISLSKIQTSELLKSVIFCRDDAQPNLMLSNKIIATRFANKLLLRGVLPELANEYVCQPPKPLVLPHGELMWKAGQGIDISRLTKTTIRFGLKGLTFHPHTRTHSQKLKKLFQEADIPFWLRPVTPLIFVDNQLVAVGGLGVHKEWFEKSPRCVLPIWNIKSNFVSIN